jgi:hypothetical protein
MKFSQSWEIIYRHVKCFKLLEEMQLYVMHVSLNRLKFQDFAGEPRSEFVAQNLETFLNVYELVVAESVNPTIYAVPSAR